MWPFKRRSTNIEINAGRTTQNRVEILPNSGAKEAALNEVKAANAHLNKLLVENGFTLKIYLAAHPEGSDNRGK